MLVFRFDLSKKMLNSLILVGLPLKRMSIELKNTHHLTYPKRRLVSI